MAIRLIVADLDGTLLNSNHVVSPFTERMIREARAREVLFTVATGKTFSSTKETIASFNIAIPVICGNGTQIFRPDGTLIHENSLPLDHAREAILLAHEYEFTPVVTTQNGLLAQVYDANVQELVDHHEPVPTLVPDLVQALSNGHKPYKIVLMNQDWSARAEFQAALERLFEGREQVLQSGLNSLVEVLPLSASKGHALAFILDHMGITPEETMTLGDHCNDLDMLQLAGIGVAMGHAVPALRASADYVTGTNDEDGVGYAIQKFVLEKAISL